jgi:hypothetical protein
MKMTKKSLLMTALIGVVVIAAGVLVPTQLIPALRGSSVQAATNSPSPNSSRQQTNNGKISPGVGAGQPCPVKAPAAYFAGLNFKPDASYSKGTSLTGVLHICAAADASYTGIIAMSTTPPGGGDDQENSNWNTHVEVKMVAGEDSGVVQRFYQQVQGAAGTKTCLYAKLKRQEHLFAQSEVCVLSG